MRVLIVDDDSDFRRWLRASLSTDERFEIVGEAKNGAEAVTLAADLTPDLILMDISMPVMNGIEASTEIKANHPGATVVIVSGLDEDDNEAITAASPAARIKKSDFTVAALIEILDR